MRRSSPDHTRDGEARHEHDRGDRERGDDNPERIQRVMEDADVNREHRHVAASLAREAKKSVRRW